MKLFKLILFFFALYFIRRFWQLYKAMEKRGRELQDNPPKEQSPSEKVKTVDAEFKVIDRN